MDLASESGLLNKSPLSGNCGNCWPRTRAGCPKNSRFPTLADTQALDAPSIPELSAESAADRETQPALVRRENLTEPVPAATYLYPHWPWLFPVRWLRAAFLELVVRPLVSLLANPTVVTSGPLNVAGPMLIIANHVTAFDGALLEYALPARSAEGWRLPFPGRCSKIIVTFAIPILATGDGSCSQDLCTTCSLPRCSMFFHCPDRGTSSAALPTRATR